jgi:hypothetical protein
MFEGQALWQPTRDNVQLIGGLTRTVIEEMCSPVLDEIDEVEVAPRNNDDVLSSMLLSQRLGDHRVPLR